MNCLSMHLPSCLQRLHGSIHRHQRHQRHPPPQHHRPRPAPDCCRLVVDPPSRLSRSNIQPAELPIGRVVSAEILRNLPCTRLPVRSTNLDHRILQTSVSMNVHFVSFASIWYRIAHFSTPLDPCIASGRRLAEPRPNRLQTTPKTAPGPPPKATTATLQVPYERVPLWWFYAPFYPIFGTRLQRSVPSSSK